MDGRGRVKLVGAVESVRDGDGGDARGEAGKDEGLHLQGWEWVG